MRLTVCQLPNHRDDLVDAWETLCQHVRDEAPDVVLLPELIASTWFPAGPVFDEGIWRQALADHAAQIASLGNLGAPCIIGARPAERPTGRHIEVFRWTDDGVVEPVHHKRYMPREEGWYEMVWFDRPPCTFEAFRAGGATVGALSCTELWFQEWARRYGKHGAHLIVTPRATGPGSLDKWLLAGRCAAMTSGCYSASSNRGDLPGREPVSGQPSFGGLGWVIAPDGEVLAATSSERPFVTVELDLALAGAAKLDYPCYVED